MNDLNSKKDLLSQKVDNVHQEMSLVDPDRRGK